MKIFISYASDDRPTAEAVAHSLRGRGHNVFLDRKDLPPGGRYEDRIERAILDADALVFLISRDSIAPGRFTLTELSVAERRWPHPDGRVLPVMIDTSRPVEIGDLPSYLRAVTILEPSGNVAAETALAVANMRSPRGVRAMFLGAATVALGVTIAAVTMLIPSAPGIQITPLQPKRLQRGYLDVPATVLMRYKMANNGSATAHLQGLEPVSDPVGFLQSYKDDSSNIGPDTLVGGEVVSNAFWAHLSADAPASFMYRICAREVETGQHCSESVRFALDGEFEPATAFALPPEIATSAVAVARDGEGFLLATRSPARVLRVAASGDILASGDLPAEPVTMSNGPHGLYVGTQGSDLVIRLDNELRETARLAVTFPRELDGPFAEPVSTRPASIAQDASGLAVITRGGTSASGILFVSADLARHSVPHYFEDIAFDLSDMHLVGNHHANGFWGTQTNTTPASLYHMREDGLTVFGGHDYDIASCATDVDVLIDGLLVPDCDGRLKKIGVDGDRMSIRGTEGVLRGYDSSAEIRSTVHVASVGEFAVGVVENRSRFEQDRFNTVVNVVNHPDSYPLPESYAGRLVDFAATPNAKLIILENASGRHDTVVTAY